MSTIVYQETLQSCYDNKTIEPMTLSLKLTNAISPSSSSKQTLLSTCNNSSSSPYANKNTWSAIESLSLACQAREQESVYVHPLSKKSTCILSDKSLEMCTESLGNETGSCVIENDHLLFSPRRKNTLFESKKVKADPNSSNSSSSSSSNNNNNKIRKFPPPLTTMSGSNPVQVKTYREDGRLVVRMESAPPSGSCLRAERNDGRLRLSFVRNSIDDDSDEDTEVDQEHVENDEINYKEQDDARNIEENTEDSEDKEICEVNKVEENVMKGVKVEYATVKMELLQYKWASRCKESGGGRVVDNERLINWESFWVATT